MDENEEESSSLRRQVLSADLEHRLATTSLSQPPLKGFKKYLHERYLKDSHPSSSDSSGFSLHRSLSERDLRPPLTRDLSVDFGQSADNIIETPRRKPNITIDIPRQDEQSVLPGLLSPSSGISSLGASPYPSPYPYSPFRSCPQSPFVSPQPKSPRLFHFEDPLRLSAFRSIDELSRLTSQLAPPEHVASLSPRFLRTERKQEELRICEHCGQSFTHADRFRLHIRSHEAPERAPEPSPRSHICPMCGRAFSRSDMLTRHLRLHSGLRPYRCSVCGHVFSRSDHLTTHQRTHTGEKPYRCPQCSYSACRRDMITRHLKVHARQEDRTSSLSSTDDSFG